PLGQAYRELRRMRAVRSIGMICTHARNVAPDIGWPRAQRVTRQLALAGTLVGALLGLPLRQARGVRIEGRHRTLAEDEDRLVPARQSARWGKAVGMCPDDAVLERQARASH